MKWFKKMLWRWTYQGRELDEENCKISSTRLVSRDDCEAVSDDPILNFKVFNAVGGKVVEFRRYDRRTDRNDSTTYIITNDQDFGERISKIATMENIKL